MAEPVVRKAETSSAPQAAQAAQVAQAQPAAPAQQMVTLEEATIMARNAANEAVAQAIAQMGTGRQQEAAAQPSITINQTGDGPPQLKPTVYIPKDEDIMDDEVVYEVNMRTFILSPYTDPVTNKFYGTPGNQTVVFKLVGGKQEGSKTKVISRFKTRDKAWCRAIEARSDFGMTINKRGESVLSKDGVYVASMAKWNNHFSNKSYTELIAAVDAINQKKGKDAIPYSSNIEDVRNNLVGYHVRLEIDGEASARPQTPEAVIEALATK